MFVAGGGYSLVSTPYPEWKLPPQDSIYRSGSPLPQGPGTRLFLVTSLGLDLPLGGRLPPVLPAAGDRQRDTEPLLERFSPVASVWKITGGPGTGFRFPAQTIITLLEE